MVGKLLLVTFLLLSTTRELHDEAIDDYTGRLKKSFTNFTVSQVLRKHLHLKAYKLSIVQHLTDADKAVSKEFCLQMLHTPQMLCII
jgi:hypothetical protein